jgi:hypothetical protein
MSFQFLLLSGSTGPGYVLKLFLVKSHKIANISRFSTANCAQEKISTDLESSELQKLWRFTKKNKILLNEISHRYLDMGWAKQP